MAIAMPPASLRLITAAIEEDVFERTGADDLRYFLSLYERHAQGRPAVPRVLDFGCGCGRLTRHLAYDYRYRTLACEANPDHVAWCREHIPGVETLLVTAPPLPFDSGSVDYAYLMSVFTHLPETAALAWLSELARVLRPGAIVAITTHGYPALDIIRNSELHLRMYQTDAAGAAKLRDDLEQAGYIFRAYSPDVIAMANVGTADYGNAFIHPDHARRTWSSHFDLVEHQPGGLRNWQDTFVLRAMR